MRRITCEVLECRVFLNAVPVGPESIVNSTTAGLQDQASIASDRTGAFVVAWRSGPFEAAKCGRGCLTRRGAREATTSA